MLCDLCRRESQQIIRVDSIQVCQWCVSNKVLEHALEVRENIRMLRDAVARASLSHKDDVKRTKNAETRLMAAYSELEGAMKELAAVTDESNKSLEQSLVAVSELKEYQTDEQAKTTKARD
jgi:hypothetical protein